MADKQVHVQNARSSSGPTDQLSQEQVMEYFVGLEYPASRQELLVHARKQNAPQETLYLIEQFPDQQYNAPKDLMKAINQAN